MVNTVYTIGYSGFSIDDFVATLKSRNVSLVVDVRSSPFSKYFPEYNKDALEICLKTQGIYYRNYANEFGARQSDQKYYCKAGYLDFEVFSKSAPFLQGIKKLCNSMEQNYTFALMCAEKDPICCHRAILVARAFFERGYNVVHLLTNGNTITQKEINTRLIEKYYPNRDQMTFFDTPQDDDMLLKAAYRKQNAEIGYRLEE
ncbi:MAG: DUF488 domain-containing protein [Ruminococcus sp.]|nr:DUF488 domain-containing protein [Ruminococcus sp.]